MGHEVFPFAQTVLDEDGQGFSFFLKDSLNGAVVAVECPGLKSRPTTHEQMLDALLVGAFEVNADSIIHASNEDGDVSVSMVGAIQTATYVRHKSGKQELLEYSVGYMAKAGLNFSPQEAERK